MLSRGVGAHAAAAWAAAALAAVVALAGIATASADSGDIGDEQASYAPLGGSPTAKEPESKLWFNGDWWGVLWSPAAGEYHLARLDEATGRLSPSPAAADDREASRADTLWVPETGKLYVASHHFLNAGHTTATPPPGSGARLYRYSYDPVRDRYTLDAGYPVAINDTRSETLVIDRDSTGTVWATWTRGSRPYVAHTVGADDARWSTPYVVPGVGTALDPDDIASLVAFGGDRIGVMWSNQSTTHFYFAVHRDGAGDGAADWAVQQVPLAASSDDHISLKADSAGAVYAAVKTSETSASRPLIVLLVRAVDGSWTSSTFGTESDSHTRPMVLLDEQHRLVHLYATGPQPPARSGQSGGDIVEKTTAMDNPSFLAGIGTPVMRNQGSPELNDATSTKQTVDARSGIVVLANDTAENVYWLLRTARADPPPPVRAAYTATPLSGAAPPAAESTRSIARARLGKPRVRFSGRRLTVAGGIRNGRPARLRITLTTRTHGRRFTLVETTRVNRAGRYKVTFRVPRRARHFRTATLDLRYPGTPLVGAAHRRVTIHRERLAKRGFRLS